MKTKPLIAVIVWLAAGMVAAQDDADIAAAETATRAWLDLVDSGQFAESWAQSSTMFQAAVTSDVWVSQLGKVRTPLGATGSRDTASADYTTSLPGAPDGEYVVLVFNTSFANKASAVETLTAARDPDGEWRIAGYFIR